MTRSVKKIPGGKWRSDHKWLKKVNRKFRRLTNKLLKRLNDETLLPNRLKEVVDIYNSPNDGHEGYYGKYRNPRNNPYWTEEYYKKCYIRK